MTWDAIIGATVLEGAMRLAWAAVGSLLAVVGFWGLRRRVKALEDRAEASPPAIHNTFNVSARADAREIRDAMESETVRSLRETMRELPQEPLGDGHTVARLPDGTNIVSMASGEYRLALPVRLSATAQIVVAGSHVAELRDADGNLIDRRISDDRSEIRERDGLERRHVD